jgi:cobalt-zinc-cadmium efflux system outer membrane protein
VRILVVPFAFWLANCVSAQTTESHLVLADAVSEAMLHNPDILAAQKRYEASRQKPEQARTLPDPTVSLGWNSVKYPFPGAGLGKEVMSNIGVMASQEFPYPGKLRLRALIAAKEADAEAQQYRATALSIVARLKIAYYSLGHSYEIAEVLNRNQGALRSLLRVTEDRYSAGRAAQPDVFRAQTQLTLIEARLAQTALEARTRRAEINSLMGRPVDSPQAQPEQPHGAMLTFTRDELLAKARDAAPSLMREQKLIERGDSAVHLAQKGSQPDFTLNGGFYTMGTMGELYEIRADVRLPRRSRVRAETAQRSEELRAAQHSYEAAARSLEYKIEEDYAAAETAQHLADLYQKTALPQARLTSESSLLAYQSGALDFLSVLSNTIAAFEYEMNYHDQLHEFHMALVRLEEVTGVELIQ